MDGIRLLESQQLDLIKRLKFGHKYLLHSQVKGQNTEIVVISGDRLQQLVDFCWKMADKYKQKSFVRDVFNRHIKGKLGEEAISYQLGDLISEVDYETRIIGDGKVDFTLISDSSVGIQVKTRYGDINKIEWVFSRDEINKNSVLVCIASLEDFDERKNDYKMIMAGFIPTCIISKNESRVKLKIEELLYIGGLNGYLKSLNTSKNNQQEYTTGYTNKLMIIEMQILEIYLHFPEYREWIFNEMEGNLKKDNIDFCISCCRSLWGLIVGHHNEAISKEFIIGNTEDSDLLLELICQSVKHLSDSESVTVFLDYLMIFDKVSIKCPIYTVKKSLINHRIIMAKKMFDQCVLKLELYDIISNSDFGYFYCSNLLKQLTHIINLQKELECLEISES